MSNGRRTFNLQSQEQMEQFRKYIGVENVGGKGKRVAKNKERKSRDGDMRDTGEDV